MAALCKFPSMEQFRHALKDVERCYHFAGLDSAGKPIYDKSRPLPVLHFKGTVKLHGTNAAIGFSDELDDIWAQSRTTLLSEKNTDQFGFYAWSREKQAVLKSLAQSIPHAKNELVYIFGEWCGGNVQKGVALQKLPKMFCIFAVLLTQSTKEKQKENQDDDGDGETGEDDDEEEKCRRWLGESEFRHLKAIEHNIYNVYDFETYSVMVDFNKPDLSLPVLEEITNRVEKQCPLAAALGASGTGEGVVYVLDTTKEQNVKPKIQTLRFKVKGSEHSVVRATAIVTKDTEKMDSIQAFVKYSVTENRLKQAIQQVFGKEKPTPAKTNDFIKWVEADVLKEESDTMKDSNLEPKDVSKHVSAAARTWFSAYCKSGGGSSK